MANPQAEEGHIDIANEIAEQFCCYRISGEEWLVLWVILRKTYGWKKKDDKISLSQFSTMTGLKRQTALRALQKLESKKIIGVIKNDDNGINIYCFNKDFDKWLVSSKKITVSSKKIISVIKKDNQVSSLLSHTKDTITKDTIQKTKQVVFVLPDWVPRELWSAYLEVRKKKRAPSTDHALNLCIKSINKLHEKGNDRIAVIEQSVERGYTGFFEVNNTNDTTGSIEAWARKKEQEMKNGTL
jgi:phage replication O-like protein O